MPIVMGAPPAALDALKDTVRARFDELPARLQAAARYLIEHPNAAAVETIKTLSDAAGVQPSVLVRLAKTLGYAGFSPMQVVFRDALLSQRQSYAERMRAQRREQRDALPQAPDEMLRMICDASIGSLQGLRDSFDASALRQAIGLLNGARTIAVIGLRRSWPVASYLVYLLARSQRVVRLVGAMGGMLVDEVRALAAGDVLVAISFHPFHADTVAAAEVARAKGVGVIAITDSTLSPFAHAADVVLEVRDADTAGFRVVAGAMALCHGLAVGMLIAATPERRTGERARSQRRPTKRAP